MKSCCKEEPGYRPWWRKKRNWLTWALIGGLAVALGLQQVGLL